MAPDARSRSSACRGEAQQGWLTCGLREWSGDSDEVELERRGESEREQLHKRLCSGFFFIIIFFQKWSRTKGDHKFQLWALIAFRALTDGFS